MKDEEDVVIHKKQRPHFSFWPGVIISVIFLFLFFWYGIAFNHWSGFGTSVFTSVIPIPAVSVNGQMITYHNVLMRQYALDWVQGSENNKERNFKKAVDVLIEQLLVEQIALGYKLDVSEDEINKNLAGIQGSLSNKDFEKKIKQELNMNLKSFKKVLIEPLVLAQILDRAVRAHDETQESVLTKAREILSKSESGESFSSLAALYSEDPSAGQGGDVGYLTEETIPDGWDIILTLKEGEISDVIETESGFVILKVAWIIGTGENRQVRTQAIILKKMHLEDLVEEYRKDAVVKYYLDGLP